MKNDEMPLVTEIDPRFIGLRADVRKDIDAAELSFRDALRGMNEKLAEILPKQIAEGVASVMYETSGQFIVGLLPFFQRVNELLEAADVIEPLIRKARAAGLN